MSDRFCRTLGDLMIAGVDILDGLCMAGRTTGNSHVSSKVEPVSLCLVECRSFTESLVAVGLFPRTVTRLAA